jgi:tripartite-type tricarboxylate transporter receptor subunit TctC
VLIAALIFVASDIGAQTLAGDRPIRLVVGYPPGGPVDVVARTLSLQLGENLTRPVIVDYAPGADGVIGTRQVVHSDADGRTLVVASSSIAIQAASMPATLPYDTLRDTTPIAFLGASPFVLVVSPSLGVSTLAELIALAKSKPGQLNYANTTSGGGGQFSAELLKSMGGIDVVGIPYKGGAPGEVAVMSGEVAFMFDSAPAALPLIKSGRLRALAVSTAKRSVVAPDVPSVAETLPGFDVPTWYGVYGPAGMSKQTVTYLNSEINKVLALPAVRERLAKVAVEVNPQSPEGLAAFTRSEIAKFAKIARDSGMRIDQ